MSQTCYRCKQPIAPSEPATWVNIAPAAASGGTMMLHHAHCAAFNPVLAAAVRSTISPREMEFC